MGRRIADDVGEALDRVDSILPLTASDTEIEDSIVHALDVLIAPKSALAEELADIGTRLLVRRVLRIARRRVRA